ncbi:MULTISPECIES: M56 family metallopeptidase [Clostridia]|uniref:M56 family metallopeptidase n=1 Tax=Clostridia TaxID=186801 RepID=UPI001314FAF8|nr:MULTISPECIES: M56 family metallopeptidase [Clostridia]
MYIADRMLINASDAEKVTTGKIYDIAQEIFYKAGIADTRLYIIDSPEYNGLATGMHIGKGTVMLTSETAKLSESAVQAILAHETIHVKKQDVMINQIGRMAILIVLVILVYFFFDKLRLLTDHIFFIIILLQLLMITNLICLSIIAQWAEIRADFLGATLLEGGRSQMASGLEELAVSQDKATEKTLQYSVDEPLLRSRSTVDRGNWILRFLEFQFLPHPPLYWRIQQLHKEQDWSRTWKSWIAARFKESLPDFLRSK